MSDNIFHTRGEAQKDSEEVPCANGMSDNIFHTGGKAQKKFPVLMGCLSDNIFHTRGEAQKKFPVLMGCQITYSTHGARLRRNSQC